MTSDRATALQDVPSPEIPREPEGPNREALGTPESHVRAATPDDIERLAQIELTAFRDVYGDPPPDEKAREVTAKYTERVELLGEWLRVLESPRDGVYGMLVFCPTNMEKDIFLETDPTDNSFICKAFDPTGENVYVINLAIMPNNSTGNRFDLFADGIALGQERGIKRAYFESRLPKFRSWLLSELDITNTSELPPDKIEAYAETYWQLKDGEGQPVDPLMRLYTDFGCRPLCLVRDAWRVDAASCSFGVFFELSQETTKGEPAA